MSALPSRRSRHRPRQKARATAKCGPQKITFRLVIEAQEITVTDRPYYLGGQDPNGHYEFRSPDESPRRIPVSETGYRSHFAPMAEVEAAPSPENYARAVALAITGREPPGEAGEEGDGQLALF